MVQIKSLQGLALYWQAFYLLYFVKREYQSLEIHQFVKTFDLLDSIGEQIQIYNQGGVRLSADIGNQTLINIVYL